MQYGDAVQLNCSLACPGGTVQWKGLDTNLGSIDTLLTHSILKISSVRVATEGIKICQGTCGENSYQNTAVLKVYCKHPHHFSWGLPLQSPVVPWRFTASRGCFSCSSPRGAADQCGPSTDTGAAIHPALLSFARVSHHRAAARLVPGGQIADG